MPWLPLAAVRSMACSEQEQLIISKDTELDGIRKSTQRVQEENERLTLAGNKCESDMAALRRQLAQNAGRLDAIKNEYATYTRMLKETEMALGRANAVSRHASGARAALCQDGRTLFYTCIEGELVHNVIYSLLRYIMHVVHTH